MIWIVLFIWSLMFLYVINLTLGKKNNLDKYFKAEKIEPKRINSTVIKISNFNLTRKERFNRYLLQIIDVFNPNIKKKLTIFILLSTLFISITDRFLFNLGFLTSNVIFIPILLLIYYFKLKRVREQTFKDEFPDALSILAGAVSTGHSITHAFEYVGKQLNNDIGREFKSIGNRLLIGEDIDDVLTRSSNSFPYSEYFFFITAIKISLHRGGQIKETLNIISRLMFDSRRMEKKKYALTAEARLSAKILLSLPIIFIIFLRFASPENYNFVMFEEQGRPIFYYVVISELIGFSFIWSLLNGVKQ